MHHLIPRALPPPCRYVLRPTAFARSVLSMVRPFISDEASAIVRLVERDAELVLTLTNNEVRIVNVLHNMGSCSFVLRIGLRWNAWVKSVGLR